MNKTVLALALSVLMSTSIAQTKQGNETQVMLPSAHDKAQIQKITQAISAQRIETYIRKLVGFETRHTLSETESDTVGIGAARRWIKAELERCGAGKLDVQFSSHIEAAGRRLPRPTEIVNVVATLKGKRDPSRFYVVSGHYDSRASDVMDFKSFAPGANDDASGTAAVMEMACVMAQHEFDASIVFMAVAAEEQGLYGAAHWAEQAKLNKMNIAGMFTNDIIGSSRNEHGQVDKSQVRLFAEGVNFLNGQTEQNEAQKKLLMTGGENDGATRQLARYVKEVAEPYVPNFKVNIILRRDRYLRGGDHIPFLERGFAALRFTEPHEDYRHQHQDVRTENGVQMGDLPEFVDFDYTAQVARVNAAALAHLAQSPALPMNVKMQTTQLENDSVMTWTANAEKDLAGYRVLWRKSGSLVWEGSQWIGNATQARMKGMSKDNFIFGIQAVNQRGFSSVPVYPLP